MLVDADGDLDELASVLVADVDAVFAGVIGSDFVDHQAGKLPPVKRDPGVLVGDHLLLVLEPRDLGRWLAPDGAGQAQRLQEPSTKSQIKSAPQKSKVAALQLKAPRLQLDLAHPLLQYHVSPAEVVVSHSRAEADSAFTGTTTHLLFHNRDHVRQAANHPATV